MENWAYEEVSWTTLQHNADDIIDWCVRNEDGTSQGGYSFAGKQALMQILHGSRTNYIGK